MANNKAYFISKSEVLGLDFTDSALETFLDIAGLDPDAEDDRKKQDTAFLEVVKALLFRPTSISEGDFSVRYDKDALMTWFRMEARRLGLDEDGSELGTVKDMSFLA